MTDNEQKADLLKRALIIVDKLGDLEVEDADDMVEIDDLIEEASKLKRNRLWKLK